jgi:hypothetical protein
MSGDHTRVQQLAGRVRWLERYRRVLAIACAAVIAPLSMLHIADALGADWPEMHATMFSIMFGVIAWWVIEVCLVWVLAVWETEYDRLVRSHGLPRAIVHRRS